MLSLINTVIPLYSKNVQLLQDKDFKSAHANTHQNQTFQEYYDLVKYPIIARDKREQTHEKDVMEEDSTQQDQSIISLKGITHEFDSVDMKTRVKNCSRRGAFKQLIELNSTRNTLAQQHNVRYKSWDERWEDLMNI